MEWSSTLARNNEIEIIQPMDTRHIAFMNMVLQGVSIMVMKELGGHKNVQSSLNYYNHLPKFVECYVYSLGRRKAYESRKEKKYMKLMNEQIYLDIELEKKFAKAFKNILDYTKNVSRDGV